MIRELAEKSRSFRGYDESRRISKQELAALVDCARLAPSSVNRQPLKYYLAWTPEQAALIQPLTKWAALLPGVSLPHPGRRPTAFIVICHDTAVDAMSARYMRDVGAVAQTILLAAAEQGLGGCMIGNYSAEKVKSALGLAPGLEPALIVALGKPAEQVVLTSLPEGGSTDYYRDENDVHYVPKRSLEELIIN